MLRKKQEKKSTRGRIQSAGQKINKTKVIQTTASPGQASVKTKIRKGFAVFRLSRTSLLLCLVVVVSFTVFKIIMATAPNPGHNLTEIGGGLTTGDLPYGSAADTAAALADVSVGSYLRSGGVSTAPLWSTVKIPNTATQGDLWYASAANTMSALADVAVGSYLRAGGVSTAPVWSTVTLPNAATQGDIWYSSASNVISALGVGTTGQFLRTNGASANPSWGNVQTFNQNTAAQGAGFSSDTYLTGSSVAIPSTLKAGSRYHLVFDVSKSAAGTATPIITIRYGTGQSTADTARLTFTFLAGTAVADVGTFEFWLTFRTVGSGSSAVIAGTGQAVHSLQLTGLQNLPTKVLQVTSAGFDSTPGSSYIGASVNGGASASWTVQNVQATLENY